MVKSILNIHENQPRNKIQKFTNISEVHSLYKDDTTMCSDEFFWNGIRLDNCGTYTSDTGGKTSVTVKQKVW